MTFFTLGEMADSALGLTRKIMGALVRRDLLHFVEKQLSAGLALAPPSGLA